MITSSILCYMYIRVTYCYYREWKYLTWCQFGRVHKTQITNIQYEGKHNYSQPPKLYINTSNIFLISQLQCTIQGDSIFNCIIIWNIYAAWAYYYLRVPYLHNARLWYDSFLFVLAIFLLTFRNEVETVNYNMHNTTSKINHPRHL